MKCPPRTSKGAALIVIAAKAAKAAKIVVQCSQCSHCSILGCPCCRRVEKRQLVALVGDGAALPCVMPDIEVIARIVTYYERWQVSTYPTACT